MATCSDVARYFLYKTNPEIGDTISNLKLQKLVYYAQGFSLAIFGTPLFDEAIKAWEHGPVVPSLYHDYKQYEAGSIPSLDQFADSPFSDEQIELLDEVYEVFGQFSAWALRNMTHSEPPWSETDKDAEISHKAMKKFFATRVAQ